MYCWCGMNTRPVVHRQRVAEYFDVYGAVEPKTGDFVYSLVCKDKECRSGHKGRPPKNAPPPPVIPKEKGAKSRLLNAFMQKLCDTYPNNHIILICDNAWWHKSKYTVIPENITLVFIPPYTPEMNPIEQVWRELRTAGFHNEYFKTLRAVETRFHDTVKMTKPETLQSITQRYWMDWLKNY